MRHMVFDGHAWCIITLDLSRALATFVRSSGHAMLDSHVLRLIQICVKYNFFFSFYELWLEVSPREWPRQTHKFVGHKWNRGFFFFIKLRRNGVWWVWSLLLSSYYFCISLLPMFFSSFLYLWKGQKKKKRKKMRDGLWTPLIIHQKQSQASNIGVLRSLRYLMCQRDRFTPKRLGLWFPCLPVYS